MTIITFTIMNFEIFYHNFKVYIPPLKYSSYLLKYSSCPSWSSQHQRMCSNSLRSLHLSGLLRDAGEGCNAWNAWMPLLCKATQFIWKAPPWCNAMKNASALYMYFSAYERFRKVLAWCDALQATLHLKLRFSMHLKCIKAWCNEHHLWPVLNVQQCLSCSDESDSGLHICTLYITFLWIFFSLAISPEPKYGYFWEQPCIFPGNEPICQGKFVSCK